MRVGPLIYEAKCLKGEISDTGKVQYLIHYNGWNKHWDEWVAEPRVLKYNDANLQKQKELLQQYNGKDKGRRNKMTKLVKPEKENVENNKIIPEVHTPIVPVFVQQSDDTLNEVKKKKVVDDIQKPEREPEANTWEIGFGSVQIPDQLKPMLVDDWDLITKQKQLYSLPAKTSVEDILNMYLEEKSSSAGDQYFVLKEVIMGMKEYFNVMLGSQLLYKFERPQYGEIIELNAHLTVCQIYGAYHLLRFFVQMGSVTSKHAHINLENFGILLYYAQDCLEFLQEKRLKFFNPSEYEIAPAEYHRKAIT
ncbi:unnamed protein product [Clavelina lepadiformis]|uniref:MRG domain-containing protein n=1 Tax=Clavelina lepadiformis TaxID=159417 RepID=A0ABP0F2Z3_CLALP